ncbi:MAG: hypothetical protein JWM28_2303 [Chitinophagaceae bacterium]|nr:hypothetical protein [Chitinophagaceae bacterium]
MHCFLLILEMKQKIVLIICLLNLSLLSCKTKEAKKESFFPVLSFIKSQVARVDTSLYRIIKQVSTDSVWDTSYIKREEFRTYAADFLDLPDLSEKTYAAGYEESKFFDASLNRVIISYSPKDKSQPIQREEVTIEPGQGEPDKVKNIIVDKLVAAKDSSTVIKRLLWIVDESFQVTTIIQKPGSQDSIQTMKISWE